MEFSKLNKHGFLKRAYAVLTILLLLVSAVSAEAKPSGLISSKLSGTVGVQMEEFVIRVIKDAEKDGASMIIFELDTPGGLVEATRGITRAILHSKVPVAVWVSSGGRAASAGAFIMQAAHISAMASGTNIGAAHPVQVSGENVPDSDMRQKVTNDLTAQMRSLTQLRKRNSEEAIKMIEESLSLTAGEALDARVIDIVADDLTSLISAINGRAVTVDGNSVTVEIAPGSVVRQIDMTFQESIIQFLSSPDIAYLLIAGGLLALFYEIITPGGFVLGIIGAIMLLMGSIGLKMLPFSWAGIALVGAGVIVMGLDLLLGAMGVLAILGIAVITAGGLFLFRVPGGELLNVSMFFVSGMTIALGLCFALFSMMIAKTLKSKVTTGLQGLMGASAEVREDLNPKGMVFCRGELWIARSIDGDIPYGTKVTVVSIEDMTLVVKL